MWENEKAHKTALDLFPSCRTRNVHRILVRRRTHGLCQGLGPGADNSGQNERHFDLKFKAKHGFQTPEYYEENGEKIKDVLFSDFAGKGYDQSGQTITSTVKNEEKLELNAYV